MKQQLTDSDLKQWMKTEQDHKLDIHLYNNNVKKFEVSSSFIWSIAIILRKKISMGGWKWHSAGQFYGQWEKINQIVLMIV